jgi:hypothetical protein
MVFEVRPKDFHTISRPILDESSLDVEEYRTSSLNHAEVPEA